MANRIKKFKYKYMPTHTCKPIQTHAHLQIYTYVHAHTCYLCKQMDQIQFLFTPVHSYWTHALKHFPFHCCRENSHFKNTVVLLLQLRLGQLKDLQFSKQSNALQAHVFTRQAHSGPDPLNSQSYAHCYLCFQNIDLVFIFPARKIHMYLHYLVVH